MLADSLTLYYAYSGDTGVLDAVRALLDYQLSTNGTTPGGYYYANVPWSARPVSRTLMQLRLPPAHDEKLLRCRAEGALMAALQIAQGQATRLRDCREGNVLA